MVDLCRPVPTSLSHGICPCLQIKEWFSKVESARGVAQRPAPSYMRFRDDGDEHQEATEEVPSLQEMQRFNTSKLELPEVPPRNAQMLKAKPMSSAWAATRNR